MCYAEILPIKYIQNASKEIYTQENLKTQELTANYYENYVNTYTCCKSALVYIHCYVTHNMMQLPLYKQSVSKQGSGDKTIKA